MYPKKITFKSWAKTIQSHMIFDLDQTGALGIACFIGRPVHGQGLLWNNVVIWWLGVSVSLCETLTGRQLYAQLFRNGSSSFEIDFVEQA